MSRPTLKLARPPQDPPIEVERIEGESEAHYEKRCASIRALGSMWWKHPSYPHPARHSRNPEVWKPAREPFLAAIREAAAADRARNPLAQLQQQIRDAMKAAK